MLLMAPAVGARFSRAFVANEARNVAPKAPNEKVAKNATA